MLEEFNKLNVLVIGDVMIDQYIYGSISGQSPEAPVPVMRQQQMETRLGGAGNVALHLKSFGLNVSLSGITGEDENSDKINSLLIKADIQNLLFKDKERPTTVKTRLLVDAKQIMRVDKESCAYDHPGYHQYIESVIINKIKDGAFDLVIFQDYNKGSLGLRIIQKTIKACIANNVFTAADPKFDHFFDYVGIGLFKPNLKEINQALGQQNRPILKDMVKASKILHQRLNSQYNIITLSDQGVFVSCGGKYIIAPAEQIEIIDVCGAGDAVLALCALLTYKNGQIDRIGYLANQIGAAACAQSGAGAIASEKIKALLSAII